MLDPAGQEDSWFPVDFDESVPKSPWAASSGATPPRVGHALKLHGSCWTRCCPRWRRVLLLLEETRLLIDNVPLQLTPDATALRVPPIADATWCWPFPQASPPATGAVVRLKAQGQEWLLCGASDGAQDDWECALQDAIAMSHGPGAPAYEWSMGATLGTGSFGIVRAATHRRDQRRAACKLVAGCHGEATRAAVKREISLMRRLRRELPAHAAVLSLVQDYDHHGALTLVLAPLCNGDLLQLVEERGAMGEAQAAAVMRATLSTLAQLHALGVCHLDVDAAPPNPIHRPTQSTAQPSPALEPEPEPEPSQAPTPRPNVNPSPRV